jgi:hypothetical protein
MNPKNRHVKVGATLLSVPVSNKPANTCAKLKKTKQRRASQTKALFSRFLPIISLKKRLTSCVSILIHFWFFIIKISFLFNYDSMSI